MKAEETYRCPNYDECGGEWSDHGAWKGGAAAYRDRHYKVCRSATTRTRLRWRELMLEAKAAGGSTHSLWRAARR